MYLPLMVCVHTCLGVSAFVYVYTVVCLVCTNLSSKRSFMHGELAGLHDHVMQCFAPQPAFQILRNLKQINKELKD